MGRGASRARPSRNRQQAQPGERRAHQAVEELCGLVGGQAAPPPSPGPAAVAAAAAAAAASPTGASPGAAAASPADADSNPAQAPCCPKWPVRPNAPRSEGEAKEEGATTSAAGLLAQVRKNKNTKKSPHQL